MHRSRTMLGEKANSEMAIALEPLRGPVMEGGLDV